MRIPENNVDRENFYLDLIQKCGVSAEERKADYAVLRNYYLFGAAPEEAPAIFNKIYPHIDQLTSFLFSAETTRFSIDLGAAVPASEFRRVPVLTKALNDEWLNSNCDQVFSNALTWALCYNSTFVKLIYRGGIHPYMIEPGMVGVLREDSPYTDRQEAIVQKYYITKSELMNRLYSHPKRDEILDRVNSAYHETGAEVPEGIDRIVMSQSNPTIYGNVNLDLSGNQRYKARVAEDTVEMNELWVWNDETKDYQVVTIADPDVVIYDRPGESVFLKGECPFIQVCPNPQYDYYWGQSEVQRLVFLQQLRNKRMTEILDLLSKHTFDIVLSSGPIINLLTKYIKQNSFKHKFAKLLSHTTEFPRHDDFNFLKKHGNIDDFCDHMRCWDGGATFFTCKHGTYHLNDAASWCEQGENKELISTDYFNTATPFLNYFNGDLCEINNDYEKCACGRYYRPFKLLQSRPFLAKNGKIITVARENFKKLNFKNKINQVEFLNFQVSVHCNTILNTKEKSLVEDILKQFNVVFVY